MLPLLISRQVSRAISADDPEILRFGSHWYEQRPGAVYVPPLDYMLLRWGQTPDNWYDDPRIKLLQTVGGLHPDREAILALLRQRCVENDQTDAIALWLLARLDPHAPETRMLIVAEARRCFGLDPDHRPPQDIPRGVGWWTVERHPHADQVVSLLGLYPPDDEIVALVGAALAVDGGGTGSRSLLMLECRRDLAAELHAPILARIQNPIGSWSTRSVPFALELGIPSGEVREAVHEAIRSTQRSQMRFLDLAELGEPDSIGAQLSRQALEEGMAKLSRSADSAAAPWLQAKPVDVLQITRELCYVLPALAVCEADPAVHYQGLLTLRQIVEDRLTPEFLDGVDSHRLELSIDAGLRYGLVDAGAISALLHAPSSRWLLQDLQMIERRPAGLADLLPDLDRLAGTPDPAIATAAADAARAVRSHTSN